MYVEIPGQPLTGDFFQRTRAPADCSHSPVMEACALTDKHMNDRSMHVQEKILRHRY